MVDHLNGLPLAKAIPDKEASTVADSIYEKLILLAYLSSDPFLPIRKNLLMTYYVMFANSTI